MQINTVIFDLDGTLLYTLDDLTDSTNYALSKFNFPPKTLDEIKTFVGNGVSLLIERSIPDGKHNPHFEECLKIFKKHYSDNMHNKTKPFDGVIEMLSKLKQNNYKIAVVSNKFDSAVKSLCNKYFKDLVDVAIGQKDKVQPKPAPDGVIEAMTSLNVKRKNCIYVGDSEVDIQTAENVGLGCISVAWGYKKISFLYDNGASSIIYSPDEIFDLI